MLFYYQSLIYLGAALIVGAFQLLFLFPQLWFVYLIVLILATLLTLLIINQWQLNKNFFYFLITPLFLILATFLFVLFLEGDFIKQSTVIVSSLTWLAIFHNFFLYLHRPAKYQDNSLKNLINYSNLLIIFFVYTSAFSFYVLAIGQLRYMIALVFITTLILSWQNLWVNKIVHPQNKFFIFIFSLMIAELYWVLHYWPTSFMVNGLLLSLVFYLVFSLIRYHFLEALTKRVAMRYFIISGIILLLTISTAQWM